MKKRFRLLIGLGIVFTLSVTVPVFATESSDPQTTESDSSSETTETIIDNITVTWQQDKETEDHMDEWYLSLTDASTDPVTTSVFNGTGAYKVGEKTYYFSEGYLQPGFVTIEAEPDTAAVETDIVPDTSLETGKTYYFDIEGTEPSKDGFGSLVTGEDQWLIFSDETGELPEEWYFLTADGEIDLTMVGIQQIDEEQWIYINDDHTLADWESGWYLIDDTAWYYLDENGTRDKTKVGYVEIEGSYYYLNEDGTLKTGIVEVNGKKYYFDENDAGKRAMVTGWQLIEEKLLYFNSSSEIANSGHNGWLYKYNHWYYFQKGTMKTGWLKEKNSWYYLDKETGIMKTGWYKDGNKTYYSNSSGAMMSGWQKIDGTWYYFGGANDGAMRTGWYKSGKYWYYSDTDGKMLTGWQAINGKNYYLHAKNGDMKYGWVKLSGKWYYFGGADDGSMKTGFYKVGGKTYYSDPKTGIMQTGWLQLNDVWYYFYPSGSMAANKWVGNYYLLSDGKMATNRWIGKYWVGEDGKWIPNYDPDTFAGKWIATGNTWMYQRADGSYLKNQWKKIDGKWYYFEADGKIVVKSWKYIGGYKYYFGQYGDLKQDLDGILAKQTSYVATVNRKKCQVMIYAYDSATGKYCIPVKTFACSVGLSDTPTPTGTFYTSAKYRWHELMGPSYGQYCTRITGGILFHSVASPQANNNNLPASEYNKLGSPASHGCVRLCVRDAKWIYDYCSLNMKVTISDTAATPFDKPATIKIPLSQTYDPTDPAFS